MFIALYFSLVWDLTRSLSASVLAAVFLTFDIGMLVLNRYILLGKFSYVSRKDKDNNGEPFN